MPAANNRLIRVVGVQVQAPSCEYPGEDIARCRDTLSRGAPDGNRERILHPVLPPLQVAKPKRYDAGSIIGRPIAPRERTINLGRLAYPRRQPGASPLCGVVGD